MDGKGSHRAGAMLREGAGGARAVRGHGVRGSAGWFTVEL